MQEFRLGGLSVKLFPGTGKSQANTLYLHGFPGPIPGINPKPKLAPQLSQKLTHDLFAPEYSGLGDSFGNFRFSGSLHDIQRVFEHIRSDCPDSKTSVIAAGTVLRQSIEAESVAYASSELKIHRGLKSGLPWH